MADIKPVTERIPVVDADGKVTSYWLDIFRGFEQAIGGPGTVSIPSSSVVLPVLNELARFDANGNLENTGMVADGDLTFSGDIDVVDGRFSGTVEYSGKLQRFETLVDQSDLASGGQVVILPAAVGDQWKVVEILLSGTGTNFSTGDRTLEISEGITVFTTITAVLLQSLASTRWGGTGVPLPTNPMIASASGQDIIAQYSGGTSDYTAGTCTISLIAAKL